ncbi:MAG: hypothetical protein NC418_01130 [Muribaculaceae bacterium]|nr:hypothetical protein [Muribaculaceae bacterium]
MNRSLRAIILLLLTALIAGSCSDDEQFRVNGTIEGKPTMNLRAGYYADGVYRTLITGVREGEFEFFASASQPTLLEITDYDYRPIGRLYVVNGETYTINIDQAKPFAVEADGSDVNSRWSAFLRSNADELERDANPVVARYIKENPADVVSTLLLLTAYDSSRSPVEADSLMDYITAEARPSSLTEGYNYLMQRLITADAHGPVKPVKYIGTDGSLSSFDPTQSPVSLIAVSSAGDIRTDSVLPVLRRLSTRHRASAPGVLDISLDPDTVAWKKSIAADSASWHQGWAPGGLAAMSVEPLGVPSVPYFVVCDSTAGQIYRGVSARRAAEVVDSLLKR